jgi:hypothetical protein
MHVTGIILDRNWRSSEYKWADQQLLCSSWNLEQFQKCQVALKARNVVNKSS